MEKQNKPNPSHVKQLLMDIIGCEAVDLDRIWYQMKLKYVERYMPNADLMTGTAEVNNLCTEFFNELLFNFLHRLKALKKASYVDDEVAYIRVLFTNEGFSTEIYRNGVEVYDALERYVIRDGLMKISKNMREYAVLVNDNLKIKDKTQKELHFQKGYNKIFKKHE